MIAAVATIPTAAIRYARARPWPTKPAATATPRRPGIGRYEDGAFWNADLTLPMTPLLVNSELIMQDYLDSEVGVNYVFDSGLRVGAAYRHFDYDDVNNLLDYDGSMSRFVRG
jgi:hypothetical protein